MERCIAIGVAGSNKDRSRQALLVNSYSASLRSLLREPWREQYGETLIPIPMANGPMVVLDLLLHFAIQGDSRSIMYVHSKVRICCFMFAMQEMNSCLVM